eukprot:TRINITY_DN5509_c0_g1_i1.p1 TRINITY_DN5509_c0_g1~~TRINITY_DN5509_c0_g1_i1.p1  ORF type:complete len:154 (+),score=31.16 TRINITY_DN5509_c0_g1_i1:40-462(+)
MAEHSNEPTNSQKKHPFEDAKPSPSLSPEQVIEIQIGALQHNDVPEKDHGIEICFRFASPSNKLVTGPINRFKAMIHNPFYECMVNFEKAKFQPANPTGNSWKITITKSGVDHEFLWGLSKQTVSPYQGCWMTDSVMKLR